MTDDQRILLAAVDKVEAAIEQMIKGLEDVDFTDQQRLVIARVHTRHAFISLRNSITNSND